MVLQWGVEGRVGRKKNRYGLRAKFAKTSFSGGEKQERMSSFSLERSEYTSAVAGYVDYGVSTMPVQICVPQRHVIGQRLATDK